MRKNRWALVVLMLFSSVVSFAHVATATSSAELYHAIVPELRDELRAETENILTTYQIDVEIDPNQSSIGGREIVYFINQTDTILTTIPFRLYPNAPHYNAGSLVVDRVEVDGRAVTTSLDVEDTVIHLFLETPLLPGATAEIVLDFTTIVPSNSRGSFGIFSRAEAQGSWVLADWYPIIAGFEPEKGWYLEAPMDGIDPTFSDAALYDVTLTAPSNLVVVTTGSEISSHQTGDRIQHHIVTGPAREFAMVLDDDFVSVSTKVGKTTINSYANPQNKDAASAALQIAKQALQIYSNQFGEYPYSELDIVDVPLSMAIGVSWTGIVFLNGEQIYRPRIDVSEPERFRYLIVHELGHQWWGAIVGSNSNDHTFLSEGLTNASFITFVTAVDGADAARTQTTSLITANYLSTLTNNGDGVIDLPVTESGSNANVLNYGKAPLGFLAIQQRIGDEAFFAALHQYVATQRFRISTPQDLLDQFEQSSHQELGDIWAFWFDSAQTTPADVEAIVAHIGAK